MPLVQDCEILENREVAPGHFRLRLHTPEIAVQSGPGQFCMIQVQPGYYPLLRRPMSFEQILEDGVTILYKVEGEGTHLLSLQSPGKPLSIQGPLGRGFPVENGFNRHILVAGGIGVAPFPALAKALIEKLSVRPTVIIAGRTRGYILCQEDFEALGCEVHVATDDGSAGTKAFAAQMLETLNPGPHDRIYACGPMIMMSTTSDVAVGAGANCLVALEAQMACGDGACLGCVVEALDETEGEAMVRVCCDGPVFDTTRINWQAHNTAYDR